MRILPIVILTLMAVHSGCGKKQSKKEKDKGPCGKPYLKELNGKCFYVGIKKINWFGAQNNCLRKGLNLADVSTVEDFKAVVHYVTSQVGFDDFWFGGNDLQSEGRFKYISSGKLVRYLGDSNIVEPTQRSNLDDCLEIRIRPNVTVVLDVNCQEKKYFICEQNQVKCAVPAEDSGDGQKHSHEHLHHFHHDAGQKDKQETGIKEQSVESDSRPADNSNSTEIGESKEKEAEGASTPGDGGGTTEPVFENGMENAGEPIAEQDQTVPPGGTGPPPAADATGAATPAPDAAAAEGATPAAAAPPAEGAPAAEAATPAPAAPEGEATPAPAA
ncbi:uncharacterized protein LOC6733766 [Drosophila simulans]|uniref:Lectin-46Ca n=1 Tax=Drosophila simulans TaxID=7240 RepID=B4QHR1_DROSI|nr:uncharacterized protein LOC6733766 [Drosophila simulans]EDX06395.1 lectin-46Ca [Drosophila simulans]KMY92576.1 lectin-46Ca [Drosophila simulans]